MRDAEQRLLIKANHLFFPLAKKIIYELDLINMKIRLELAVSKRLYHIYSLHTTNIGKCWLSSDVQKRIY